MIHLALSLSQLLGHDIWHWKSGIGYQWWSGIGSVFTPKDLIYLALLWKLYRAVHHHFECHEETCTRLGVHHVAGTHFRTCWPHHPVLSEYGHKKVPLAHIHAAHDEADGDR